MAEDVQIRKYIKQRLPNAGVAKVEIARTSKVVTVAINTARPGIVIGRGGEEVARLKNEISHKGYAIFPDIIRQAAFFPQEILSLD